MITIISDAGGVIEINSEIAITKQAVSFFNDKIKGDYSITFEIDNNSVNRKILGYYGPQMINQVAWTRQGFTMMRDGNVFMRGSVVIQQDNGDTLSCYFIGGNSNWMNLLTGIITELDFTSYRQQMSESNIYALRSATEGIIFPLVDWAYNFNKGELAYAATPIFDKNCQILSGSANGDFNSICFTDFYPCFYLKSLVKEIFQQNGLKFTGTLFSDQIYNNIVITPSGDLRREATIKVTETGYGQKLTSGASTKYLGFGKANVAATITTTSSGTLISQTNNRQSFLWIKANENDGHTYSYAATVIAPDGEADLTIDYLHTDGSTTNIASISQVGVGSTILGTTSLPTPTKDVYAILVSTYTDVGPGAQTATVTINIQNTGKKTFTGDYDPNNQISNYKYTATEYGAVIVTGVCTFASSSGTSSVYKNGSLYKTFALCQAAGQAGSSIVPVIPGDYIEIYVSGTSGDQIGLNVNFKIAERIGWNDYVLPNNILTDIKCIDIIKWVTNYFGCVTTYNEFSKTVTINILEKLKLEDSLDWSNYFIGGILQYSIEQAKNNYVEVGASNETQLQIYDNNNKVKFGGGNIETDITIKDNNTLFKSLYGASGFDKQTSGLYSSYIGIVTLKDDPDPIDYTAVSISSISEYTIGAIAADIAAGEVMRITNEGGGDLGYFICTGPTSATKIAFGTAHSNPGQTGKIYRQSISFNKISPRILYVKPSTSVSDISSASGISVYYDIVFNGLQFNTRTSEAYGYFQKKTTGYNVDKIPIGISWGDINEDTYINPVMKDLYFNKISNIIKNPKVRAKMIIPEAVFQSFDYSRFIYLKTNQFTGYFFVDDIVNYQDSNTPVEVNLYML